MAYDHGKASGFSSGLTTEKVAARSHAAVAPGPFDVSAEQRGRDGASLPDALITGLLVVYPVLAIVVAVVVGFSFSGSVG